MIYRLPQEIIRDAIRDGCHRQNAVADASGISPQYFSDIVSGKRVPPPCTLVEIAYALAIPAESLMWGWLAWQVGDEMVDAMREHPPAQAAGAAGEGSKS